MLSPVSGSSNLELPSFRQRFSFGRADELNLVESLTSDQVGACPDSKIVVGSNHVPSRPEPAVLDCRFGVRPGLGPFEAHCGRNVRRWVQYFALRQVTRLSYRVPETDGEAKSKRRSSSTPFAKLGRIRQDAAVRIRGPSSNSDSLLRRQRAILPLATQSHHRRAQSVSRRISGWRSFPPLSGCATAFGSASDRCLSESVE